MPTGQFTIADLSGGAPPPPPTSARGQYTLADLQGASAPEEKPSLLADFAKYSPAGFVRGIADALRDPKSAVTGMLKGNEQLWEKAKDSYQKGDYTAAAAHFLNYLVPGGAAMDDAGEDFSKGDYARGTAKTAGIATTMLAGQKASAVLDAATNPDLPGNAGAVVRGAVKGAAKTAVSPGTYRGVLGPELAGDLIGLPKGTVSTTIAGARIVKGAVAGAREALSARLAQAADALKTDAGESAAPDAAATAPEAARMPVGAATDLTGARTLPPGPRIIEMPGASLEHDASYVRAVPGQYGEKVPGWEAPAAAEARTAATKAEDLDGLAKSLAGKPFAKLNPQERDAVTRIYAAGQTKPAAQPQTAPPAAVVASPASAPAAAAGQFTSADPGVAPPAAPAAAAPSIAEQLRAEVLKDPSLTAQQISLPEEESAPDPEAIRDLMRSVPPEAGRAIARANYAGNPDSPAAGAVYEAAARNAKAAKLAQAMHDAGITHADASGLMNEGDWKKAAEAVGAPTPKGGKWIGSQTVDETLFHLRKLEAAGTQQALPEATTQMSAPAAQAPRGGSSGGAGPLESKLRMEQPTGNYTIAEAAELMIEMVQKTQNTTPEQRAAMIAEIRSAAPKAIGTIQGVGEMKIKPNDRMYFGACRQAIMRAVKAERAAQ